MPTTRPQTSKVSCAAGPAKPDGELKRRGDFAKKNTTISRKRTGDAASRRPEPGQTAPRRNRRHPPPRDKEHTISPAGNDGERARRRHHLRAVESVGALAEDPLPRSARPAPAAAFVPIARSSIIGEKEHGDFAKKNRRMRPAGGPSRSNCAAPESSAPPAKG